MKKILDNFADLEDTRIVKYSGIRPIKIVDKNFKESYKLGLAYDYLYGCTITLDTGLSGDTLKHVLLHEYLHCMGFRHVKEDGDLMSEYLSFVSENNIKKYAKLLRRKMYGKR